LLIIVIVVGGYLTYASYVSGQPPGNSIPLATPTPTPILPGESPTPAPTSTTGTTGTGTLWQSLLITNKDGSTYWVNAPQPFALQSIFGAQAGTTNFNQVASESNGIWVKLDPSLGTISSWQLSCQETISITDTSGNIVGNLVNGANVNANGYSLATGSNQVLTSCGQIKASDVTNEISGVAPTTSGTQYNFEVTLSNIQLILNTSNGQVTLTASSGTQQNTLVWPIEFK